MSAPRGSGSGSGSVAERPSADETYGEVWGQLVRASHDRHHEWRTPVLASTGLDGTPQARTVVLRRADAARGQLCFYTDRRSPKVHELRASPVASLVFWSRRLNWQLRLRVRIEVLEDGPVVESAWAAVGQSHSAGDYLSASAPGDPILAAAMPRCAEATLAGEELEDSPAASVTPEPGGLQGSSHFLAVLVATVESIDWLELSRAGHRRALFADGSAQWRVP